MKSISRRTVLRGAGGLTLPLPLLDIMRRAPVARAEGPLSKTGPNGMPKRFILFFSPNGQGADFIRSKNDAQGKLLFAPALSALQPHAQDILMLDGINNKSALHDGAKIDGGHVKPHLNLTTCRYAKGGNVAGGISIDQAIAKEISAGTKVPSLELGVQSVTGTAFSSSGAVLPFIQEPRLAFKKLFSDFDTQKGTLARINADRKSVLDGIKQDYAGLVTQMSGDDRVRLESHFENIREVEKRLDAVGTATQCIPPAQPANPTDFATIGDLHISLLATAVACDVTRVASLVFNGIGKSVHLPHLPRNIHDASHAYGPGGWPLRNQYSAWFAGRFAALLAKLKSIDEGGRSALDNSVVFWCSEHGCGNHNYDWMPMVVAGSGGGYFKTGRRIAYPNRTDGVGFVQYNAGADKATGPSQSELYVSFLNAMGVPTNTFGVPEHCRGPLPGLTG